MVRWTHGGSRSSPHEDNTTALAYWPLSLTVWRT